ncbi:MAG TPA: DUF4249 family protein [Prolixibacteraceae bacterium]|nr:DUF4249 family protein [Prolixibacteraceae bacterium]
MKKYSIIIILLTFISCTKDLELPYEKSDQTIVVNCLFSEAEPWKVTLTRIKSYADSSDSYVEDARVAIVPENKDTIHLSYSKNGIYLSQEMPVSGIEYQLVINDGKPGKITAKSSIPVKPVISEIEPSTQYTIYFSNANLSDFHVLPLNLKITGDAQTNFVRFRISTFNTMWGYTRELVTKETISELSKEKFPEDFVSELEKYTGVSKPMNQYFSIIRKMGEKYGLPPTGPHTVGIAMSKIDEIKVKTRYDDAFISGILFSNSNGFSNVSRDKFNVFGEYSGLKEVSLFVTYIPVLNKNDRTDYQEEYWLEVVGMSEDYYKYQKSFIKQVVNQKNPFASVIEVHTNIQNGVGIFAGYNRQRIHYYDY